MKMSAILVLAILSTAVLEMTAFAQDRDVRPDAITSDEQKLIRAVLHAKDLSKMAVAYVDLFKSVAPVGLRRLKLNASDTIAIQAAWQEVELTVPIKPKRPVRPDRDALAGFVGFLEGRARIQAPDWWADAVLDARANRRGNIYAGGLNYGRLERAPIRQPRQAKFETRDDKPVVRVGRQSVTIPDDLHAKLKPALSESGAAALITPSRCYVAVYDSAGFRYKLACVDRSTGKIQWLVDVWATTWGFSSGLSYHWVELTEQANRVVVFGISSSEFYVEAFRADDGANLFRFSNSYARWLR